MKELIVTNSISLNTPVSKVWYALTNPEQTKRYMFGCEAVSDWKVGSELLWKGEYEGKVMIFVKGTILAIEPNVKLIYTTFDPNSSLEDKPENYVAVTYELKPEKNGTLLTVSQGDFSKVADGERRFKEVSNNGEGWNPILVAIKSLVETGQV